MPSEKVSRRLQDIIDNAQAILRYTEGMDLTAFTNDRRTYDAVERCMERICEAIAKLGERAPQMMGDHPWRDIRGLGNILRHQYDTIREDRLFDIVRNDLPSLLAAAEAALRRDFFPEP